MSGVRSLTVAQDDDAIRLDRWFKRHFPGLGHGRLEKLLRTGQIRIDGARAKASARVSAGQAIRLPPGIADEEAGAGRAPPALSTAEVKFIRSLVLYRDDEVIAIDKPAGLAVQGGSKVGRSVDGLLDGLRFEADDRPRLVHRLDKDTSGVLALARSRRAAARLVEAFREGAVEKTYWALVSGVPKPPRGIIDLAVAKKALGGKSGAGYERMVGGADDGKRARTAYSVVAQAGQVVSWLSLMPQTGRTHQIRVHCEAIGTPILGDRKYGGRAPDIDGPPRVDRLMLHARRLVLPKGTGAPVAVAAPLDPAMRAQWSFYGFEAESERDIESFTAHRSF